MKTAGLSASNDIMPALIGQMNEFMPGIASGAMEPLGGLLVLLEDFLHDKSETQAPLVVLARNLKRLTEELILEQVPDTTQAIGALRQGIVLAGEIAVGQVDPADWEKFQTLQMRLAVSQGQVSPPLEMPPAALNEEDARLSREFVDEAEEHLQGIENALLRLEARPNDEQLINSIFRPFHTIKGVSGFLNFADINKLAHELENVLDLLRRGEIGISRSLLDIILEGVGLMEQMLANIRHAITHNQRPAPLDTAAFLASLEQAMRHNNQPRLRLGEVVIYKNLVSPQCVAQALVAQKTRYAGKPLGQVLVLMGFLEPAQLEKALGIQQTELPRRQVKVEAEKIDSLMTTLDELLKLQENLATDASRQQRHNALLKDALSAALAMARVPIGPTFNKLNRLVRDLANKQGKKARLKIIGQEVEVKRELAESIYEPLVHMVRNSLDHGLEIPAIRRQNHKPEVGLITLAAGYDANGLSISVSDDGRGLDHDKIKARLREKGINTNIDNNSLFACLFAPGFSTARQVTDISGRGVGLDVVKTAVEQLGGNIKISTNPGRGTCFEFNFPGHAR